MSYIKRKAQNAKRPPASNTKLYLGKKINLNQKLSIAKNKK